MTINWIMDQYLLDRATAFPTGRPSLSDAARAAGHGVFVTERQNGSIANFDHGFEPDTPLIAYGSHPFVREVKARIGNEFVPCAYHKTQALSYSAYAPYLGDLLLNDDFVLLPYAEMKRRRAGSWGGSMFVRPDAVTKAFTGFVLKEEEFDHEINALDQIGRPDPETLVVIARPKNILAEFRFVIADGEVVTGSEYRWDGRLDIRSDIDPACLAMAKVVAEREWQADTVYVCDVALTSDLIARVVELNTFSCAGLYACDTDLIVRALEKSAWAEFLGN